LLLAQLEMQKQKGQAAGRQLEATTVQKDTITHQRKKDLSKIYEAMAPEDAAKILQNLKDGEVLEILLGMQKRQAAKVLSLLDPSRAAKIFTQIN
jgi:flagellar motility protein MotE (MotC chaperone)